MGIGKSRDRLQATYELCYLTRVFEFCFMKKTVHDIAKGQIESWDVQLGCKSSFFFPEMMDVFMGPVMFIMSL